MSTIKNSLYQSHYIAKDIIKPGDTVVDATAGNGNDTVYLAELVGDGGKVYSFDIQQEAIMRTKEKIEGKNIQNRVILINDGHQNMKNYISSPVKAVIFNLGYLPGGDHNIATKADTTIQAINKSLEILEVNGLIIMVVYYGGDSGFEEKEAVLDYVQKLDCRKYTVMKTEFINQVNCPPILVCIEKI